MNNICPICHKAINSTSQENYKFLPFCSERCKLLDLGLWLDSDYKIISTQRNLEPDQDFDMPDTDLDNT